MDNPIYTYKGKRYEILREECDSPSQPNRAEGLLADFLLCEKYGDWMTIRNRISGGLMWGWLREIEEESYVLGEGGKKYGDKWERGKKEGFNKEVDGEEFW